MARNYLRVTAVDPVQGARTQSKSTTTRTTIEEKTPSDYTQFANFLKAMTRRQRQEYGDLLKIAKINGVQWRDLSLKALRDAYTSIE